MEAAIESKARPRLGDLGFRLASFQEEPPGPWPEERACEFEETRQRRKSPRAHHVRPKALSPFAKLFNARRVDVHRRLGCAHDFGKEGAFLAVAFDQVHAEIRPPGLKDGDDEPGKACP